MSAPTIDRKQYDRALAEARARVIQSGKEGVYLYVALDRDGFNGDEVVSVPGYIYEEQYRKDDCLAVVWSYRDDDGQIKAATETRGVW